MYRKACLLINANVCSTRAGIPLPPNFEHIPLNKIHRDKLSALGVEYQHIAQRASAQEESQLEE